MAAGISRNSPVGTAVCFPGSPFSSVRSQSMEPNLDGSEGWGRNSIGRIRNRRRTCFFMSLLLLVVSESVQAAAVVPAAASRNNLSIRTFGLDPGPFSSCFDASVVPAFNSSSDT